ncbi:B3/B4 domain-containing protein (DNA/RNA-binding domain of Phe-tRNA-synthetase) [Streptomyces sp. TLI_053]|uniref:B3/B4 domain-containing protein n=1 Tax=Streptomyces sp. TLI_053 TaxID=1855352 RepID=UPI00087BD740|nr:phenylalanine--tRNA ligase beta subunit-related protein [Streptomyces sp. TLI_053]SDT77271.1 B3/B4 domain-containing protein (DNA/RNA-binding domain of Phe-tRNA-synthetase) [Streptomyces sp. TLI_053]
MLEGFSLDPTVSRDFPDCQVRFVRATGLRNREEWAATEQAISNLQAEVADGTRALYGEEHAFTASWFEAYRKFGTNPRRSRPSVNALARRMEKSGTLPRVNPAVDTYNFVSVSHGLPAGAFDLDRLTGHVLIRYSAEGDWFAPIGEPGSPEAPKPGEVVYAQGSQVLTRHWNHRDADATKITEESSDIVFLLERVDRSAVTDAHMRAAQELLADLVRPHADEVMLDVIEPATPDTTLAANERTLRRPGVR